jgi:hypothetical protein
MRGLFGDAPRDLEFVGGNGRLVLASRDFEVELPIFAAKHEEPAISAGDPDNRIDDTDQELVQIERAGDRAAGVEKVVEAIEVGGDPSARRSPRLGQKIALPLREPATQALKRVRFR